MPELLAKDSCLGLYLTKKMRYIGALEVLPFYATLKAS